MKELNMSTAMLNVRLEKSLKREGDRVLSSQGVSATEAVRGLYRFLEQSREVPDFCRDESKVITAEQRRKTLRQLVGIAHLNSGEDITSLKKERLSRFEF